MGIFRKLLIGPLGDAAYRKHRRDKRRSKKAQKKYDRQQKKALKKGGKHGGDGIQRVAKDKYFKKENLNPAQTSLLNYLSNYGQQMKAIPDIKNDSLYQAGRANLMDLLSNTPQAYEKFKAPTMAEFNREVVPEIADRFSLYGGQRSSSFQNALSDAGGQLGLKLGALRAGLQQSAIPHALGYAQQPISNDVAENQLRLQASGTALGTSPFTHFYQPATYANNGDGGGLAYAPPRASSGTFGNLLGAGATIAGGAIGTAVGGPIGGAIGTGLGNLFSRFLT